MIQRLLSSSCLLGLACLLSPALVHAEPPANDNRANAIALTGPSGRLLVSNVDATKEPGEINHAGNAGGKSIWFSVVPATSGSFRIDTIGTEFDTTMSIIVGTNVSAAANNDNLLPDIYTVGHGGYTQSRLLLNLTAGTTYFFAVDGWNPGSGAPSGPVVLNWFTTNGPPANDNFTNATEVIGNVAAYSGRSLHSSKEPGEPNHAGDPGGRSVWYKWTPSISGQAVVDTFGSSFDTTMAVYTGTDVAALTEVASSDDVNGVIWHGRALFNATAGQTYYIAVDGYTGSTVASGSIALHCAVVDTAPTNNNFAASTEIAGVKGTITGSSFAATKEASEPPHGGDTGGQSVWYSWTAPADGLVNFSTIGLYYDTLLAVYTGSSVNALTLVPGAETDDLITGAIQVSRVAFNASSGTVYRVAVDGFAADYGYFNLNWEQTTAAPTNDLFASATTLEGRLGSVTNSNSAALVEQGEPLIGIINNSIFLRTLGGKSLWYKWTATSPRPVTFDTFGSSFDTTLAVLVGSNLNSLVVITNKDNITSGTTVLSLQSAVTLSNVTVGTTYYIHVDGFHNGTYRPAANGTAVLNYSQPGGAPTNDFFTNAIVLVGRSGLTNGNTLDATAEVGEPEHAAISPTSSAWYRWTPTNTGWVTFDTLTNANVDTVLAAYTGTSLETLAEVTSNDDAVPGSIAQSSISFLATAGTTYRIAVDSKTQGTYTLRWRPTVTLQARKETTGNVTLIITAAAPGFYSLQDSPALTNPTWVSFDSVQFTDPAGGSANYDAGPISQSQQRYFRVTQ